jgi:hypothetical protein
MFENLMKASKLKRMGDNLIIFDKPNPRRKYTIGSDVATGRARDYSAGSILDDLGVEVGCYKKKLPIDELSYLMGELGQIYNRAMLAPESNDIGLGVASKLQSDGYHDPYYSVRVLKEKHKNKPIEEKIPGWYTTSKNRPLILGELEEDIRVESLTVKNPFFTQEAYTFIYDERNRPVAMGKGGGGAGGSSSEMEELYSDDVYTDDSIFGLAIANHVRKIQRRGPILLPV